MGDLGGVNDGYESAFPKLRQQTQGNLPYFSDSLDGYPVLFIGFIVSRMCAIGVHRFAQGSKFGLVAFDAKQPISPGIAYDSYRFFWV
jgi:hypothetical protein